MVEGKKRYKDSDVHELSQSFATEIPFATIQRERHRSIHGFPIIRIHPGSFDIIKYNTEFDLLLISYLGWTKEVLSILWIVEHYKLFPITHTCMQNKKQYPSGYLSLAKTVRIAPKNTISIWCLQGAALSV